MIIIPNSGPILGDNNDEAMKEVVSHLRRIGTARDDFDPKISLRSYNNI